MTAGGTPQCRVVVVHAPADRRFASLLKRDLVASGAECQLVEHEGQLGQVLSEATLAAGSPPWLIALLSPAALGDRALHAAVEAGLRLVPRGGLRGPVPFVVEPFDLRLLPPGWAQLEGFDGSVRYIEAQRGLCALLGLRSARGQEWIEAEPTTALAALPRPEQWGAPTATGTGASGGPLPQRRATAAPEATLSPAPHSPQSNLPPASPTLARRVRRRDLLAAGAGLGVLALLGAGAVLAGKFADSTQGHDTGASGPRLRWTSTLNGSVTAALVADAGIVYALSNAGTEGTLYALSALNGASLWRVARPVPMSTTPALAHGVVYAAWADGLIAALSARDGARRWSYRAGGQLDTALATAGGVVYATCEDQHLYALDARTGQLLWKRLLAFGPLAGPAVTDDTVYVSGAGGVAALDVPTGALLWQYPVALHGPYFTAPAVQGDAVYVGARDSTLYALAAADGAPLWHFTARDEVRVPPSAAGDGVYVSSLDTRVYALEAGSGKQIWDFLTYGSADVTSPNVTSPVIHNGTVYIGTDRKRLFALSAADGTLRWSFTTSSPVRAAPAITGAMLLFAATDGTLYGLSA